MHIKDFFKHKAESKEHTKEGKPRPGSVPAPGKLFMPGKSKEDPRAQNSARDPGEPGEILDRGRYIKWSYHSIPITIELSRRKDEEELLELFRAQKFKSAVINKR